MKRRTLVISPSAWWITVVAAVLALGVNSCSVTGVTAQGGITYPVCTFTLGGINNFRLAGVSLYGKTGLDVADQTEVLNAFARGELPVSFILNVMVRNADTTATGHVATALASLSWTMIIDSVQTIEGDIPQPIAIPADGRPARVPIWMTLDLRRYFKYEAYDTLVSLAFALGGAGSSARRITLRATPTIRTASGDYSHPGEIEIMGGDARLMHEVDQLK